MVCRVMIRFVPLLLSAGVFDVQEAFEGKLICSHHYAKLVTNWHTKAMKHLVYATRDGQTVRVCSMPDAYKKFEKKRDEFFWMDKVR